MSVWGLPLFSRFIRYVQHDSGEFVLTTWSKVNVTSARGETERHRQNPKCTLFPGQWKTWRHATGSLVPSILGASLASCVLRSAVVESTAACSSQGQCGGLTAGGWEHSDTTTWHLASLTHGSDYSDVARPKPPRLPFSTHSMVQSIYIDIFFLCRGQPERQVCVRTRCLPVGELNKWSISNTWKYAFDIIFQNLDFAIYNIVFLQEFYTIIL